MMRYTRILLSMLSGLTGVFLLAGVTCAELARQSDSVDNQPTAIVSEAGNHEEQPGQAPSLEEADEADASTDMDEEVFEPAKQFKALLERYLSEDKDESQD
jgi:hypothetical protein